MYLVICLFLSPPRGRSPENSHPDIMGFFVLVLKRASRLHSQLTLVGYSREELTNLGDVSRGSASISRVTGQDISKKE